MKSCSGPTRPLPTLDSPELLNTNRLSPPTDSQLKPSWGIGTVIAILLSVVAYLFNLVNFTHMVSLLLLLCGTWTVVSGFIVIEPKDRMYYVSWGVVVAAMSLFAYLPANYAVGLILLAVVALIVIAVYLGKTPRVVAAATAPTAPAGETPAAT